MFGHTTSILVRANDFLGVFVVIAVRAFTATTFVSRWSEFTVTVSPTIFVSLESFLSGREKCRSIRGVLRNVHAYGRHYLTHEGVSVTDGLLDKVLSL
jgi:hypothetical protein